MPAGPYERHVWLIVQPFTPALRAKEVFCQFESYWLLQNQLECLTGKMGKITFTGANHTMIVKRELKQLLARRPVFPGPSHNNHT